MSVSDTLGDSLTRLRNGYSSGRKYVSLIDSNFIFSVFNVFSDAGYVGEVRRQKKDGKSEIIVSLCYTNECVPAMKYVLRISKPGKRIYVDARNIGSCNQGLGLRILSTSNGVIPSYKAKKIGIGGEVLCDIF